MTNLDALWREDATLEETVETYQDLIDTGQAWRLEGTVGRTANDLIEQGYCMLGEVGHYDFWGNYVPSRHEVQDGTKGSASYVAEATEKRVVN